MFSLSRCLKRVLLFYSVHRVLLGSDIVMAVPPNTDAGSYCSLCDTTTQDLRRVKLSTRVSVIKLLRKIDAVDTMTIACSVSKRQNANMVAVDSSSFLTVAVVIAS